MDDTPTPPSFPESEVDKLVKDFGREPKPEEMTEINKTLEAQRPQYEALQAALKSAEEAKQSRQKGRSR